MLKLINFCNIIIFSLIYFIVIAVLLDTGLFETSAVHYMQYYSFLKVASVLTCY